MISSILKPITIALLLVAGSMPTLFAQYRTEPVMPRESGDSLTTRSASREHFMPFSAASMSSLQDSVHEDEYLPSWHSMVTNIPMDIYNYGKVTIRGENLPLFLGMTALTTAMVFSDDATYQAQKRWFEKSQVVRTWSDIFTEIGDGRTQFGLAAGFGAWGLLAGDRKALRTASQVVEAVLTSGFVVQVFKHLTGRESPKVASAPGGRWEVLPNQVDYHKYVPHYDAYPSGHLTTTLATVVVIAENYPEVTWIKPVGYSIGALLAISMVNNGIHWYSDYPLAIAFGYGFGMIIAHPERYLLGEGEGNTTIAPYVSPTGNGIQVQVTF